MSKAFVAGLVAGVALLVAVTVGASRRGQEKMEEEAFRKEMRDATPVELGVLTDKQLSVMIQYFPNEMFTDISGAVDQDRSRPGPGSTQGSARFCT